MTTFPLTLHRTYYRQGFFNVASDFDRYLGEDGQEVTLLMGDGARIAGRVNRSANLNGTARVMGGFRLRDWFHAKCREQDRLLVEFLSTGVIRLQKAR